MNCFSRPQRTRKVTFNNKIRIRLYEREETRNEKLKRLEKLNNEYMKVLKLIEMREKNKCKIIK